jgi:hypothetical protein
MGQDRFDQLDSPDYYGQPGSGERHTSTACPECDDVSNECCRLCEGTDQWCPICRCPADQCEYQEE